MKKLLMVSNVDWFFISHRLSIAQEATRQGWEVFVAAENTGRSKEISNEGITFIDIKFSRSGINPIEEILTLYKFRKLYKEINPDIVHHITLKPVIYGSLIAKVLKIKGVVNSISGLGYNFTEGRKSLVQKVMLLIMKFGFNRKNVVIIFQNENDQKELTELGVIHLSNSIVRIKGSGVDLEKFYESPFPSFDRIKILLPIRMLWDKGVKELREASDILNKKYYENVEFILSGLADEDNKAGVPASYLNDWQDGNFVKWIGYQKNMVEVYQNSHIVVLPSYREGMPKSLIEACAIGRAIITTNAIGCRECVDEGINGLKVPVKDAQSLANAIETLVNNPNRIIEMGKASRLKAKKEFDINFVLQIHSQIYNQYL
jgi:glycosyltransferase involved in cell wall biosynthesis